MGRRNAVKSATLKFGEATYDMETGPAVKGESRDAVEVTALSDTVKRFIKGALKELDEFTLPLYMKGENDITVDDDPAALEIEVVLENGIDEDISGIKVSYAKAIVTKVAPSQIQASSDRKALYDVTFRPDGSEADESSASSSSSSSSSST